MWGGIGKLFTICISTAAGVNLSKAARPSWFRAPVRFRYAVFVTVATVADRALKYIAPFIEFLVEEETFISVASYLIVLLFYCFRSNFRMFFIKVNSYVIFFFGVNDSSYPNFFLYFEKDDFPENYCVNGDEVRSSTIKLNFRRAIDHANAFSFTCVVVVIYFSNFNSVILFFEFFFV